MALDFESIRRNLAPVHIWTYLRVSMIPNGGPQNAFFQLPLFRVNLHQSLQSLFF